MPKPGGETARPQNHQLQIVASKERLEHALSVDRVKQALTEAIPQSMAEYMTYPRITRIMMSEVKKNPKLLECTLASVLSSLAALLELGLEPSSAIGKAYLVPFRNGRRKCVEAQAIIGYRGYIELMFRSDRIVAVESAVMHEHDDCLVCLGDNPTIEHQPELKGPRGDWFAAYCVISMKGGGKHREVMSRAEIEIARATKSNDLTDAWRRHPTQMARKTVIRRAAHYVPMSQDLARGIDLEDSGAPANDRLANVIDASIDAPPSRADTLADQLEQDTADEQMHAQLTAHGQSQYDAMIGDLTCEDPKLSVVKKPANGR